MPTPKMSGHMVSFDKRTVQVCSQAGINIFSNEMIRISKLRSGLATSIRDIEKERSSDRFFANVGLTLSFVKASCDAFIEIAGALVPQGSGIAKAYGAAQDAVELSVGMAYGDKEKMAKSSVKIAKGFGSNAVEDAVDLQMISVDGLQAAISGSGVDTAKSIADYGIQLTKMSAAYKGASKKTLGYFDVAKSAVNAGHAFYKVYEEYKDMKLSDENFEKMKKAQLATINSFDAQIRAIMTILEGCGQERGIKPPSMSSIPDLKMPYRGATIGPARR